MRGRVMISYDGWDREYLENKEAYLSMFDRFMSQTNYENNEEFENKLDNEIRALENKLQVKINDHGLELFGVCKSCLKN